VTNFAWGVPAAWPAPPYGSASQPNWTKYNAFLQGLVATYQGQVSYWEFWNEPDLGYSWPGSGTNTSNCPDAISGNSQETALLYKTYENFYQTMHSALGPGAMLVAPSLNHYCLVALRKFLGFAVAHHLQVNVLSWHELAASEPDLPSIAAHLKEARAAFFNNPTYQRLNLQEIHINETVGPDDTFDPGEAAAYLYFTETGGADFAVRSCFGDASSGGGKSTGCQNNTIDSVLAPLPPGSGPATLRYSRATGWVYTVYASLRQQRVPCTPPAAMVCFAGLNSPSGAVVLIGSIASNGSSAPSLELKNLRTRPDFASAKMLHVVTEELSPGQGAVVDPSSVQDVSVPFTQSSVTVPLQPVAPHQAMVVTVSPGNLLSPVPPYRFPMPRP